MTDNELAKRLRRDMFKDSLGYGFQVRPGYKKSHGAVSRFFEKNLVIRTLKVHGKLEELRAAYERIEAVEIADMQPGEKRRATADAVKTVEEIKKYVLRMAMVACEEDNLNELNGRDRINKQAQTRKDGSHRNNH